MFFLTHVSVEDKYFLCFRKGRKGVCGKIAAYQNEICHPDNYQCLGNSLCKRVGQPQNREGSRNQGILGNRRPCRGLRGRRLRHCRQRQQNRSIGRRKPERNFRRKREIMRYDSNPAALIDYNTSSIFSVSSINQN